MSDLELVKICAERMGIAVEETYWPGLQSKGWAIVGVWDYAFDRPKAYWPISDDAQCMAMIKRFGIWSGREDGQWWASAEDGYYKLRGLDPDLNRAVCLCVSRMK